MAEQEVLKALEEMAIEWASFKSVKERMQSTETAFRMINNLQGDLAFRKQYFIQYYSKQQIEAVKGLYR